MDKRRYQWEWVLILCVVVSLGVVSFVSCIAAEMKRTKEVELKVVGRLCRLPESEAFGLGISALICLIAAQIVANFILICTYFSSRDRYYDDKNVKMKMSSTKAKTPTISMALLSISWSSFLIAIILLSTATSMSREQPYGRGWLDGQCYLVKQGIYIASGILVLITVASTICLLFIKRSQVDDDEAFKAKEQSKLKANSKV